MIPERSANPGNLENVSDTCKFFTGNCEGGWQPASQFTLQTEVNT
ncbi:hypothetical protein FIC_01082 [Flavobacteriaceae bacterium 3519-10]|nr:hypothetical protein FIC_01082 [Flavobacteriaceae bacterium 3519-10]